MATKLKVVESKEPVPTVSIAGEVDHFNYSGAEAIIKRLISEGASVLIINLTDTTYVDTAGVAMIFWTAKQLMDRGGQLRLVVPPGDVRRILELAGIGSLPGTKVFDNLQAAFG